MSKIQAPVDLTCDEDLSLLLGCYLPSVSSPSGGRDEEVSGVSSCKGSSPMMAAPPP